MKTIILKANNETQTISEHDIIVNNGQPTVIDAMQNINYELVDSDTGNAPYGIFTRRQADDLYITMDNSGREADLIIIGYYNSVGNEVIGLAQDGNYYHYVPVNTRVDSFIATLDEGEQKSQMLGGESQTTPWWVGATEISVLTDQVLAADTSVVNSARGEYNDMSSSIPLLMGLVAFGAIVSELADDDDGDAKNDNSNDSNDVVDTDSSPIAPNIVSDATNTIITPNDNTSILVIDYVDVNDNKATITINQEKGSGIWSAEGVLPDGVTLDQATGEITILTAQLDSASPIKVTAKDADGDSTQAIRMGDTDDTVSIAQLSTDYLDGGAGIDTLELTLSDVVATDSDVLNIAGFEMISMTGNHNHYNIDTDHFSAGNDNITFVMTTGSDNVIDLGNNNKNNDINNVDLDDWSQGQLDVAKVDAQGNTHLYDVYTNGTDMLYIQTDITVI